jgi:hypothetical protein
MTHSWVTFELESFFDTVRLTIFHVELKQRLCSGQFA